MSKKEIKYFHPSGRNTLPNGIYYQKGNFIGECRENSKKFVLKEGVVPGQRYRGGVMVFCSDIVDGSLIERFGYTVGHAFRGKYLGQNGKLYDEKSFTIEITGVSSRDLLRIAEQLSAAFGREAVLVKDLNKDKIYLAEAGTGFRIS